VYRLLFHLFLKRLSAETAHHLGFACLRAIAWIPGVKAILSALVPRDARLCVRPSPRLAEFAHPIGLAAGFDKDARGYEPLGALGFSFVEVGTITAVAQPGNPKPRLFRLVDDRAVINRMGFNNGGAEAASRRLDSHRSLPVGVNIGKTKIVPEEAAAEDYGTSSAALAPLADYLVVNVSSPNTPGLRQLQSVEKLRPILERVLAEAKACASSPKARSRAWASAGQGPPVFVKIAPDLADEDIDAIADLSMDLGLTGIIATNTTIARTGLRSSPADVDACGAGGLSGEPLRARSLDVLRRLRTRVGSRLVLVSVGGIATSDDVWDRLVAGASLVQIYTAFIYEGPLLVRGLVRGLQSKLDASGRASITDVIGSASQ